jgi:sorbitol-specific phosphotransferase system component IIBC
MSLKRILFTLVFSLSLLLPLAASAQVDIGLDYGKATGLGYADPRTTTAQIIRNVLGLLGIITTCIILYAGFKWMTSGGSEEDISKAKSMLSSAVIGLLIIMSAYSITIFVISSLAKSTTGTTIRTP